MAVFQVSRTIPIEGLLGHYTIIIGCLDPLGLWVAKAAEATESPGSYGQNSYQRPKSFDTPRVQVSIVEGLSSPKSR